MSYGLLNPDGNVVKIEENIVNVATKSGWNWYEIVYAEKPKFNEFTHKLCEPSYTLDREKLYQVWSIEPREESEIEKLKNESIENIHPVVLKVLYSMFKEKSPSLTLDKFKEQLKSLI